MNVEYSSLTLCVVVTLASRGFFLNYCTTQMDPSGVVCASMLDSRSFKRSFQRAERPEEPDPNGIRSSFRSVFAFVHPVSLVIFLSLILILIIAQAFFSLPSPLSSALTPCFIPSPQAPLPPPALTPAIIER